MSPVRNVTNVSGRSGSDGFLILSEDAVYAVGLILLPHIGMLIIVQCEGDLSIFIANKRTFPSDAWRYCI